LASPSDATAAVTADAAVPMLNRVSAVTGARVTTSLHPNPSAGRRKAGSGLAANVRNRRQNGRLGLSPAW
jgi:hypothetical protein